MYSLGGACVSGSDGGSDGVSHVSEEYDRGSSSSLATSSNVDSFGTKTTLVTNKGKF